MEVCSSMFVPLELHSGVYKGCRKGDADTAGTVCSRVEQVGKNAVLFLPPAFSRIWYAPTQRNSGRWSSMLQLCPYHGARKLVRIEHEINSKRRKESQNAKFDKLEAAVFPRTGEERDTLAPGTEMHLPWLC